LWLYRKIVDGKYEAICECFEREQADEVCEALNAAETAKSAPAAVNWPAEVAVIWARLYRDHADDAMEMTTLLATDEQRQAALKEFDEGELSEMEEAMFSAGIKAVSRDWYIDATSPGGEPDRFGPYDTPEETNKARERLASRDYHGFSVPYQWSGE
jgi:hypothetical protein